MGHAPKRRHRTECQSMSRVSIPRSSGAFHWADVQWCLPLGLRGHFAVEPSTGLLCSESLPLGRARHSNASVSRAGARPPRGDIGQSVSPCRGAQFPEAAAPSTGLIYSGACRWTKESSTGQLAVRLPSTGLSSEIRKRFHWRD